MKFCNKCGALVIPQPGQLRVRCKCGRVVDMESTELTETIKQKKKTAAADAKDETLPITNEQCPQCKNETAYWWTMQTRASDEAETQFFKCTKCNHTWRVY